MSYKAYIFFLSCAPEFSIAPLAPLSRGVSRRYAVTGGVKGSCERKRLCWLLIVRQTPPVFAATGGESTPLERGARGAAQFGTIAKCRPQRCEL